MKLSRRELIKNVGLIGLGGAAAMFADPVRVFGELDHAQSGMPVHLINHAPQGKIVYVEGPKNDSSMNLVIIGQESEAAFPLQGETLSVAGSPLEMLGSSAGECVAIRAESPTAVKLINMPEVSQGNRATSTIEFSSKDISDLVYSPDGTEIALSMHTGQYWSHDRIIQSIYVDVLKRYAGSVNAGEEIGRPLSIIPRHGDDQVFIDHSPRYSPDSRSVAYVRNEIKRIPGSMDWPEDRLTIMSESIRVLDIESGDTKEIYRTDGFGSFPWGGYMHFGWLDSERLAWVGLHSAGAQTSTEKHVLAISKEGKHVPLAQDNLPSLETRPYGFSPDGKRLVLPLIKTGELGVLSLDDGNMVKIPARGANPGYVALFTKWSPDSQQLLYSGLEAALGMENLYWVDIRAPERSMRITDYHTPTGQEDAQLILMLHKDLCLWM